MKPMAATLAVPFVARRRSVRAASAAGPREGKLAVFAVTACALSACVSTQDVSRTPTARYVGKPSETFFARFGAPDH